MMTYNSDKIIAQEAEIISLKTENTSLQTKIVVLEADNIKLKQDTADLMTENTALKARLDLLERP